MYTSAVSCGGVTTVCVCEPRQVCTLATGFGCAMSLMSKMRMPRSRSLLTESDTPWVPQSRRPPKSSPDVNRRLRWTETSFCWSGQTYAVTSVGRSEEHTSELQSPCNLVCRLLLEKKKKKK